MIESHNVVPGTITQKPLGMIDVVNLQEPSTSKSRDWVWLAETDDRFSIGMVINRGKGILIRLYQPHYIGVDEPKIRVTMSEPLSPNVAQARAKYYVGRWMLGVTGNNRLVTNGRSVDLRSGDTRKRPPILSVEHRETDEIVRAITLQAIPFDISLVLRCAPCFGRVYEYDCNWAPLTPIRPGIEGGKLT
jgi:hypothetical protein